MLVFLNQFASRLDLPLEVRRKMWFKPFMQSYGGLYRLPDDVPDSQEL